MFAFKTIALRGLLAIAIPLAALTAHDVSAAETAAPSTAIHFTFDRPVDASMAPFFLAAKDGNFGAERLNVSFKSATGSPEALARVAKGGSELALVDINELIRFRDKDDAAPVKAVFMLFNRAPYAIVARRSRGIHLLSDLDGKTVGVADGDLSMRLWPALAQQNGINVSQVKFHKISAAVREPLLSAGQVDAVAGFSYLSAVNLRDRGVPGGDLVVLRYADYGCEAYGFAVVANPAFAATKPDAVKGFVRALIAGVNATIKEPARAADEAASRIDDGDRDLERERLRSVLIDNILTDEVKRNGLGGIDPARLDRSIDQIAQDFKFRKRPAAGDIFDDRFLPPVAGRLIN
ncbi:MULTISPECIES: ABC transporter substrate-binding protein [Bradyrhizobium]|uniref:ABC transporter substrate-binding protein n=1 Tax=Bradyrhizobium TaxID=374 RepID=UPI000231C3CA|nr:ABC transporter substrate-binding protein [Bradyrhizobium japonicum]AJA60151.1 nitrate ABC transporter substrate-binding protein [Bradyrhizobium japonicum]KMK00457.1 nitrate ABC transporter substrate-binding protein [Bradyrhizobium japonicum]MCS3535043.1 NitT/TauT family transport system substrate-binding protein [Bradyrhizobium japonicum]MCS3988860.1 NitT/TauT family transport system substrate-binding protein [Bradyrhizobium japonicum]MCS4016324.1 NitT/TauT family transport system substrat